MNYYFMYEYDIIVVCTGTYTVLYSTMPHSAVTQVVEWKNHKFTF